MKKNISAILTAAAAFMAVSAAAVADGPVGRAVNGAVRAGEDIVDGAGDAVGDVADGITDGVDDITGVDDDTTLDPGDTGDDITLDPGDTGDDNVTSPDSEPSSVPSVNESSSSVNSGAVGGVNVNNPGTGVSYGLTAAAAVLAAAGIAVSAARKTK